MMPSSVLNTNAVMQNPNAWMSFGYGPQGFGSPTQRAQIVGGSADADPRSSERSAESPVSSTPKRIKKAADQQVRQATTLQLTNLLQGMNGGPSQSTSGAFPWWETAFDLENEAPVESSSSSRPFIPAPAFHTMTCLDDGTIGLLVDPGAHDNLAGSNTIRHLANQIGAQVSHRRLELPLSVSGVGKEAQQARDAMIVEFQLMGQNEEVIQASYCAPVIDNSNLPPLLGLKSLVAKRALLDMRSRLLIFPGQGGVEVKCSPGTQLFQLEMSQSGHLLLPIRRLPPRTRSAPGRSLFGDPRLDFPMKVRKCRSLSPDRRARVHGDAETSPESAPSRSSDARVRRPRDATTPSPLVPDSLRTQTIMTGRRERTPPRGHRAEDVQLVEHLSESSYSPVRSSPHD